MANWRQIQGRIRRARTSADPAGKLNELFQKTRDAMVAFEAGAVEEKAGRSEEAIRWYTIAAQRFRRPDWRQKAGEALTRLGVAIPEVTMNSAAVSDSNSRNDEAAEATEVFDSSGDAASAETDVQNNTAGAPATAPPADEKPRRRRGRRGGRRHRRGGARERAAHGAARKSEAIAPHQPTAHRDSSEEETSVAESVAAPEGLAAAAARFVPEPSGPFVERSTYIRAGDPALASRFAQLESLLRRLISAPLRRVDDLEDAPAGPGVFLLSDSDLMSNYYVEACQTLRIGVNQLARSGRAGRGARSEGKAALRSQLAEHLEISDTQVTDYLRKHCVVRWLQLDEEAPHLAHFAIALLRPALNTD